MPITIGVFITPGKIKTKNAENAIDRFNRSFEYDGLGDNYLRFLLEIILPFDSESSAKVGNGKFKISAFL